VTYSAAERYVAASRYTSRYKDSMNELALANHLQEWRLTQLVPPARERR